MQQGPIKVTRVRGKLPFYFGFCFVAFFSTALLAQNTNIKITQVYYNGGVDENASFSNDFIELYNDSDQDVNFNGEYALAIASFWQKILTGTIKARSFYLIQYASGFSGGAQLPTPDFTGDQGQNIDGTRWVLFYYQVGGFFDNPTVIDDVDFRADAISRAPTTDSSALAVLRKKSGGSWQDTGSSASDFELGTPFPRSSSYVASPTISGAATAAAFTTTYGTASAAQSFNISGSNLTANLVATAPTGFEVSADGTTYGTTATFTQTGGSASGTLLIRLKADAAPGENYNSQNIVLSSTGAADVNISTTATGNLVVSRFAAWSGTETMTTQSVGRYAIGGASNSSSTPSRPTSAVSGGNLTLTAIVRTNDPKLKVEGETSADLIAWATNAVTSTNTTDQTGVDTGHARKTFSVPQSSDGKKFLRLKATLNP